jgi:hypothetical protein
MANEGWRRARVALPARTGKRFLAVELRTFRNAAVIVQVGKPVLDDCRPGSVGK